MTAVGDNALVELTYTLKDDTGLVVDCSQDGQPYTYVHGHQEVLPALEAALAGMRPGDEKDVTLPPEDAYGTIDPEAVTEVPKHLLPPDALVPGTEVTARKGDATMYVTVKEVRDDTVVLSLNHPLAGKRLHAHLRVVQVIPQPA